MRPTPYDISFNFCGFQTTIQPFFWVLSFLIVALSFGPIDNMQMWIAYTLVGMAGILISILTHELGHALVFRYVFQTPSAMILHSLGAVTVPLHTYQRGYGFRGAFAHCFLFFAGPLAGFILAFLMLVLLEILPDANGVAAALLVAFLKWTAFISIFWGIINLMPIYPMDGGQISREFFQFLFPRQGIQFSLILSMMTAALLGGIAIQFGMYVITIFFAFFAFQNFQELTGGSFRR